MSAEVAVSVADRLAECEEVVRLWIDRGIDAGLAVRTIRDERLYRESHETFEDYCRDVWGWERAHAYRMISAANTREEVKAVSPMGDIITNERQAREVAAIIRTDGPERAAEVLQEVADAGPVTAKAIRETARPTRTVTVVEEVTVDAETGEIVDPDTARGEALVQDFLSTSPDMRAANVRKEFSNWLFHVSKFHLFDPIEVAHVASDRIGDLDAFVRGINQMADIYKATVLEMNRPNLRSVK